MKNFRPRERRFVGKSREWKIVCPRCQAVSKTIKAGGGSMAPAGIVKKLTQAGWLVGDSSKGDLCPDCLRKPVKSRIETARKALHDVQAPMVPVNGHKVHFNDLKMAASALDVERAKELIEQLKQQMPPKPPKKPKAEPPPKMAQSDYENWLAGLEQPEK
jgi:hypothetical protein